MSSSTSTGNIKDLEGLNIEFALGSTRDRIAGLWGQGERIDTKDDGSSPPLASQLVVLTEGSFRAVQTAMPGGRRYTPDGPTVPQMKIVRVLRLEDNLRPEVSGDKFAATIKMRLPDDHNRNKYITVDAIFDEKTMTGTGTVVDAGDNNTF